MSTCRRCHRALKREPWRSLGIGKICKSKEDAATSRASEDTGDIIVPYEWRRHFYGTHRKPYDQ